MYKELIKKWNDFWINKQHKWLNPHSLIAPDKTVLFTTAGMQQLVPYLMGKPHPLGKRLYNIQKCLRTNDIDEVGDERHLTFFEMMGNWSLNDYFKKESLTWSIEFLTKELNLDIERIGASVFKGENGIPFDSESEKILKDLGVKHIVYLGFDDNFWGPAGNIGPCGPCCEIYYDRGIGNDDWNIGVNDRYTEIWNNVFMEYYKDEKGNYIKMELKNVDTGMGLERLLMILEGTETIFETEIFKYMINIISSYTKLGYNDNKKKYRIIMDHMRASIFLISDGLLPYNEGRGYVLRRLLRRAFYNIYLLGIKNYNSFVKDLVNETIKFYDWRNLNDGSDIIIEEFNRFSKVLEGGKKMIDNLKEVTPKDVFVLYDTYGFPYEMTKEILKERGIYINEDQVKKFFDEAKNISRNKSKDFFKKEIDWSKYVSGIEKTIFVGFDTLQLYDYKILKEFEIVVGDDKYKCFIFDKTPFYATGGGQLADKGKIILDKEYEVVDVINYAGVYIHICKDV